MANLRSMRSASAFCSTQRLKGPPVVDVLRYHDISESTHRILNPLSAEKQQLIGDLCVLSPGMRQLDAGFETQAAHPQATVVRHHANSPSRPFHADGDPSRGTSATRSSARRIASVGRRVRPGASAALVVAFT
jgi:hypothetical protein